jgi:putative pyruvate formate lyase activating enzyme
MMDDEGIARQGLLVRHLVLPGGLAGTGEIASFLAECVSKETYINVMDQYRPCYEAGRLPPLDRPLTRGAYREALEKARDAGLHRFDRRDFARRRR